MGPTPQCTTGGGDWSPCETGPAPALFFLFSHLVWHFQAGEWQYTGFPVLHYLLEFAQTHVHWVREAIQPSCPLLSPSRLAFDLCSFRVFPNELALCFCQNILQWVSSSHQGAKVLEISFSISPSNEYSGRISFRIAWFDLLAVQGTVKSLLQHHSSKTSILWHATCFIIQLSHPSISTGKTIALTIWIFVGKVMSQLFICCVGLL